MEAVKDLPAQIIHGALLQPSVPPSDRLEMVIKRGIIAFNMEYSIWARIS